MIENVPPRVPTKKEAATVPGQELATFRVPDKTSGQPRKTRTPRRPTLATALAQASKAGVSVASATIEPNKVTLIFGAPEKGNRNPWDTVLNHDKKN